MMDKVYSVHIICESIPDYGRTRTEWERIKFTRNIEKAKERLREIYSSFHFKSESETFLILSKYYPMDEEESRLTITFQETEEL